VYKEERKKEKKKKGQTKAKTNPVKATEGSSEDSL